MENKTTVFVLKRRTGKSGYANWVDTMVSEDIKEIQETLTRYRQYAGPHTFFEVVERTEMVIYREPE